MISRPSDALVRKDASAIRLAINEIAIAVRRVVVKTIETTFERVPALPAVANESTRVAAGLSWLRDVDENAYLNIEGAVIDLAQKYDVDLTEFSASCEGVARLAQEIGADLASILATPRVARPVTATIYETRRAYAEIFGEADRAFQGKAEAAPVRVTKWENLFSGNRIFSAPSEALEAKEAAVELAA